MKYFCGYIPDAMQIGAVMPTDPETGERIYCYGNHTHAHPMRTVGTDPETGAEIREQIDEQAMGIIAVIDEIPPCFDSPGVEYWELPAGLSQAKAKAEAVGILWSDIPQIFGMEFL